MIFMDYSPFANTRNKYFKALNETTQYKKVRFEKATFDEIHMLESIDIICNQDKKEWDYDTVFLWKCSSVEAGNIELSGGIPINQLLIRRRKKDDFIFENVKTFNFDKDSQFYEFKDRFIESYEDYVYGIQPMGGSVENPILGETTMGEVESKFDSVWIVGKDIQYKLMFNLEVGDYETIIPTDVVETLGNQYPKVVSSGNVKYRKGNIQCMLVSDETHRYSNINPKEEKKLRRSIMAFLTNRKPKYFKDGSGETILISILNAPKLSPRNELNQLMYDITIDFVEIGDTDTRSLINAGLIEEV